jgi:hypothetical protein
MKKKQIIQQPAEEYFMCDCCDKSICDIPNVKKLCIDCQRIVNAYDENYAFQSRSKSEKILVLTYKLKKLEEKVFNLKMVVNPE